MDQEIESQPRERKGIQPRTIKGMPDEQWHFITEAADEAKMTIAQFLWRSVQAAQSGQTLPPRPAPSQWEDRAEPRVLDLAVSRVNLPAVIPGSPQAVPTHEDTDHLTAALSRADVLIKLAEAAKGAATLDNRVGAALSGAIQREIKAVSPAPPKAKGEPSRAEA